MVATNSDFGQRPVIIIGAGRSGTNMLRDLLCSLPDFATWPCDEINYIWRHGHRKYPTDEFPRSFAEGKTATYLQLQFDRLSRKFPGKIIVEKTCANSLRCGFVHEAFPAARFIHIVRDGRDVAASAALRWNAKLDLKYLAKKARYVPLADISPYAIQYLRARVYRVVSGKSRLSTWGPKFSGMQEAFGNHELPVACAIQWKRCVDLATSQLHQVSADQVLKVRYEDFVAEPVKEFAAILSFLQCDAANNRIADLVRNVSQKSVGNWRKHLSELQQEQVMNVAGSMLAANGYLESEV